MYLRFYTYRCVNCYMSSTSLFVFIVDYLQYGKKYPEKLESLQNHSKSSAPRVVTDFSSCGQSAPAAAVVDDNKKYQ